MKHGISRWMSVTRGYPVPSGRVQGTLSLISGLVLYFAFPAISEEAPGLDFNNDILPILADKCFQCHGPDSESRKGDLRLDTKEGAFADLGGYFAIEAGGSENSEVVIRMFHDDPDELMPPPKSNKPLTDVEKDLIVRWIDEGAKWQGHWAFDKVKRASVGTMKDNWCRNPIDFFIKKGHAKIGLTPNPEASRYALARRAALDIIGLPPEQDELQAFIDDKQPQAYERYIDKLLASKHYGEHRARFWLDAARYSDTHGLHLDNFREMWLYRDWVIDAYNQNKPFDQFTIEQLAGDLLPEPTKPQLIATGFVRNNASSSEAGSIPEELKVRYMVDRAQTASTVFLGLTAGCAACHDHKFDPISQKEFYQLGAFFNNSEDPPMDGNMRDTYPVVVVPESENEAEWYQIENAREELRNQLARTSDAEMQKWWAQSDSENLRKTHPVSEEELVVYAPFDHLLEGKTTVYINGEEHEFDVEGANPAADHPAGFRGVRFEEKGGVDLPVGTIFQLNEPVTVSMWLRTPDDVKGLMVMSQWGEEDKEKDLKKTGWNIELIPDGAFEMPLRDDRGTRCNSLMPSETPVKPRQWQHIAIRYSGGQAASSISYYIDGKLHRGRRNSDTWISYRFGEHMSDILTIGPDAVEGGISDFRIYKRWLLDDELKLLANEFALQEVIERKPKWQALNDGERKLVSDFYKYTGDEKTVRAAQQLGKTQTWRDYLYARSPTTLVMQEKDTPPSAHVLIRGEYDQRGETVFADTPAVLPSLVPEGSAANRLDLARWLVDIENPLTARVTVNRIWQSFFGTGLVATAEDFGVMGEKPTHPELLDWLAVEFQAKGWDVKELIRLIVTSATYRQDARIPEDNYIKDPGNRYLARGARRRLDAEVLRDQALAVSGILNRSMGGPSVKPYQPSGVWQAVAFQVSNTNLFVLDPLEKLHRRSVYSFWKRTAIPPAFAAFDAPSREECSVRRERTNTPLQALVLLNDVQHIEAARSLAELLIDQDPGQKETERAKLAFYRVVGRPAKVADLVDLVALAKSVTEWYQSKPEDAKTFISAGKLPVNESLDPVKVAAWTVVINALLNRDDVINQS